MNQAVALSATQWIASPSTDYLLYSSSASGVACTGDHPFQTSRFRHQHGLGLARGKAPDFRREGRASFILRVMCLQKSRLHM